jgi:hypothetical protein
MGRAYQSDSAVDHDAPSHRTNTKERSTTSPSWTAHPCPLDKEHIHIRCSMRTEPPALRPGLLLVGAGSVVAALHGSASALTMDSQLYGCLR